MTSTRVVDLDYPSIALVAKSLANPALAQYGVLLGHGGCDRLFGRRALRAFFAQRFPLRVVYLCMSWVGSCRGICNLDFARRDQALLGSIPETAGRFICPAVVTRPGNLRGRLP